MAGGFRKIMAYLGLVDDEYDDYNDLSDRNRAIPARPNPGASRSQRPEQRSREYEAEEDDYYAQRPEPRIAPVTRIRPMNREGQQVSGPGMSSSAPSGRAPMVSKPSSESGRVQVVAPMRFGDAKEIGDFLRQSTPVILNLQEADHDLRRRMIDFCSGVVYAIGCSMEKVADQVFLLTPNDVTVSLEERAQLERRGFNRDF